MYFTPIHYHNSLLFDFFIFSFHFIIYLFFHIYRSLICVIINAVCAALMDAGVMTKDMITSCSAGIILK